MRDGPVDAPLKVARSDRPVRVDSRLQRRNDDRSRRLDRIRLDSHETIIAKFAAALPTSCWRVNDFYERRAGHANRRGNGYVSVFRRSARSRGQPLGGDRAARGSAGAVGLPGSHGGRWLASKRRRRGQLESEPVALGRVIAEMTASATSTGFASQRRSAALGGARRIPELIGTHAIRRSAGRMAAVTLAAVIALILPVGSLAAPRTSADLAQGAAQTTPSAGDGSPTAVR